MRALIVTVPEADCELAADALFALGVAAIEERHGAAGRVDLWTHVGDGPAAADAVAGLMPAWPWRFVEVDESIADTWRSHAAPVRVTNDVVVVPAWADHQIEPSTRIVVPIDPGAAFGLGDHPTTVLCLRAVVRVVGRRPDVVTVLDVGSGSGVLGVVAAPLGVQSVVAIDHHAAAVEATIANAGRNGVADRIEASGRPLTEVEGEFALVVANLLAPALVELSPDLVRVTAPGGLLIVSGLLDGRYHDVVESLAPMVVNAVDALDGWVAIELSHP